VGPRSRQVRPHLQDRARDARGAAFDPTGKRVALGSYKQVRVFDVETAKELALVEGFYDYPFWVDFSHDGKFLRFVVMDLFGGKALLVADPVTGNIIQEVKGWAEEWTPSADGNTILARRGGDRPILYHVDPASGKVQQGKALDHSTGVFRLGVTGRVAVTGAGEEVILSEVPSGKRVASHSLHVNEVTSVAPAPDGKLVASAGRDKAVILWDVAQKKKARGWRLEGIAGESPQVAFSPGGQVLATWNEVDRTAELWSVADGKKLGTVDAGGEGKGLFRVYFSPGGKRLATKDYRGDVKVWDLAPAK
jgi:WD40 repeat protein